MKKKKMYKVILSIIVFVPYSFHTASILLMTLLCHLCKLKFEYFCSIAVSTMQLCAFRNTNKTLVKKNV